MHAQVLNNSESEPQALLHSTNLVGIPTSLLASTRFNESPVELHIAGTISSAQGLFHALEDVKDHTNAGDMFQRYMHDVFGDNQPRFQNTVETRRYKNSYLRLIQDWGMDSNNAQAAVLKGWVESRFGLYPTYHKHAITSLYDKVWIQYLTSKMHSRYHNNCIYMQLDLLYEFCQWFIKRFEMPARKFITLYRGVNALEKHCAHNLTHKRHKIIRFNNLTSFTDNVETAGEFGDYVLKVSIPVVKLVFFNQLLPEHALRGESEYLAIGGFYKVELI